MTEGDDVKKADLTVEILKDIRQEIRQTNSGLEAVRQDLGALRQEQQETNLRLDALGRRVVEGEIRTASALTALAHDVRELTGYLRVQGDLRPRVERCEKDIADLKSNPRPPS